jgi:hypothetical protein
MVLNRGCEYGTMLHITHFSQLEDGCAEVKTIGGRRFKVIEWGEKDGYNTGRFEWVDDVDDDAAGAEFDRVGGERFRLLFSTLINTLPPQFSWQLVQVLGEVPRDDYQIVFWVLSGPFMPERAKYEICFGDAFRRSHRARLRAVLDVLSRVMLGDQAGEAAALGENDNVEDQHEEDPVAEDDQGER